MKWNQKGLAVCLALFVVVLGLLILQSVKRQSSAGAPMYASEEDMISLSEQPHADNEVVTGKAARFSATMKPKSSESRKPNRKKDTGKPKAAASVKPGHNKKSEKKSEKAKEKPNQRKKAGKKTPGKVPEKTAVPTKIPATATSTAKPDQDTVRFEIQCKKILDKQEYWKEGIEEIIPTSGVFYSGQCSFTPGDTVYDLLKRICQEEEIALDSTYTVMYGSYYIRGIGNLYEFDCGSESGWKYAVNDVIPSIGSSQYKVRRQDRIVFYYDYQY